MVQEPQCTQLQKPRGSPNRAGPQTSVAVTMPKPPHARSKNKHCTEECLLMQKNCSVTQLWPLGTSVSGYIHSLPCAMELSGPLREITCAVIRAIGWTGCCYRQLFYSEFCNYSNLGIWQTFAQKEHSKRITSRTSNSIWCWWENSSFQVKSEIGKQVSAALVNMTGSHQLKTFLIRMMATLTKVLPSTVKHVSSWKSCVTQWTYDF